MKILKEIYVLFIIFLILSLFFNLANAGAGENQKGKIGAGIGISALNFNLGPLIKYWITDNIGAQAIYSAIGGFKGFNIQGIYEFSQTIELEGEKLYPYIGIGYISMEKEEDYGGASLTYKGSGFIFSGGVKGSLSQLTPNLYYTTELGYSPLELEAEYKAVSMYGGGTEKTTVTADYSSFGVGFSLIYYFY